MQTSDLPTRFPIPFANNAGGSYIRPVPQAHVTASGSDAPASLYDGFPPETFTPVSSGGVPPNGKDFNGILNQVTAWARWQAAGGAVSFDGTFSTAIGGYPKGARMSSTVTAGLIFVSTVDNNTTDPDSGGSANWLALPSLIASSLTANGYRVHNDGYTECWGTLVVGAKAQATVTYPRTYTTFVNLGIGPGVQNSADARNNTGILTRNLSGFTLLNWEVSPITVDWNTRGL
jgi:hypothetical protein